MNMEYVSNDKCKPFCGRKLESLLGFFVHILGRVSSKGRISVKCIVQIRTVRINTVFVHWVVGSSSSIV